MKRSDEYPTRANTFAALDSRFGPFDLDPCCTIDSKKAPAFFTLEHDGLRQPWHGRVYMNPPYNRGVINLWMEKAVTEVQSGRVDLLLAVIPASTCASWWHAWVEPFADEIAFIKGRQHFEFLQRPAFSTCAVVFRSGSTRRVWAVPVGLVNSRITERY